MRYLMTGLLLCGALGFSAQAQKWEVGAVGAYASQPDAHVTTSSGEAAVKFKRAAAIGAYAGHNMYRLIGGELRYMWRFGAGEISSGSLKYNFPAHQQLLTYDIVMHAAPRDKPIRPYVAAGGGVKWLTGTGNPVAFPPLVSYGAFVSGTEVLPVVDVAGGVKVKAGSNCQLRLEFRDVMGPTPGKVFTTAPGAKISAWTNDLMVVVGVGWVW